MLQSLIIDTNAGVGASHIEGRLRELLVHSQPPESDEDVALIEVKTHVDAAG